MDSYTEPRPLDILCGRGKTHLNHRGNQQFRALIAIYLPKYADKTMGRKEKTQLVQRIVEDLLTKGSRFLKQDPSSGHWVDVSSKQAKLKVGHALRDATAEMNRNLHRARSVLPEQSHTTDAIYRKKKPQSEHYDDDIQISAKQPTETATRKKRSSRGSSKSSSLKVSSTDVSKDSPESSPTSGSFKIAVDDSSSASSKCSSDDDLFPSSQHYWHMKYADMEPISIPTLMGSQGSSVVLRQGTPSVETEEDTKSANLTELSLVEADDDLFLSVLEMLTAASSIAQREL